MAEENRRFSKAKFSEIFFIQYVSALIKSGMQDLGKLVNPETEKIEQNLEGTQAIIGLLIMLKEKTKGNLSPNEEKTLYDGLSNLQHSYADEATRREKEKI